MSEQKHTPGPWVLEVTGWQDDRLPDFHQVRGDHGKEIADVHIHSAEMFANARLIAAAPEMLAALRSACAMLSEPVIRDRRNSDPAALIMIRSAIAKATGQ